MVDVSKRINKEVIDMSKVFECIYAYIYKNNYAGSCSLGKQIYTITNGLSPREVDLVTGLMPSIDNSGVAKVDSKDGVKLDGSKSMPDYDLVSFAYYPTTRATGYKALSRFGLRKSLKDKSVRGTREIAHAIIFNNDFRNRYIIDYLDNPVFRTFTDIQLNEGPVTVDDSVCEVKPSTLEPIELEDFVSSPLTFTDIYNLGAPATKSLSEIINAIFIAKKNRKTAYIVYDPADWELAVEYIKVALKLLPAHVANELSFITCYGKKDSISIDICGVPTRDDNYISLLEKKGCLVRLDLTGAIGMGGEKVPFAAFLNKATAEGLENWLDESANFYEHVESLDDINDVIELYLNRKYDENDESTNARLKRVANGVALITRNLNLITKIPYECRFQINSIKSHIEKLCAEIQNISAEALFNELFVPTVRLYSECEKREIEEKRILVDMIYTIIFGTQGQNEASARKHFEFLSYYNAKIMQELINSRLDIINYMESRWGFLHAFFEDYFDDAVYVEYAATFSLELLKVLLRDVEREGDIYSEIRDYFVLEYLSVKSNQLVKILDIAFAGSVTNAVFKYALTNLLKLGSNYDLYKDRIETFSNFLIERKMLEVAILYFRDKFVAPFDVDAELVETILGNLLKGYILLPRQHTMGEIYKGFKTVQSLIGPHENLGLQKFLYDDYAQRIINPIYDEAIKQVRFEDTSDADKDSYRELLQIYKTVDFAQQIDRKFCLGLEDLLDKYEIYKSQSQREGNLVGFRVDFVARELILLDAKTILALLNKHIGEEKVAQRFYHEGIEGKPQKHERFLEVCELMTRDFLLDKGKSLSDSDRELLKRKKVVFAEEIRRVKSERNRGSRFRRLGDGVKGIISSTIFTAVMAVFVAVVGYMLFNFYDNGYFKSIYFFFTILAVVISEAMYWYNFRDRRMRSVVITAAWQTTVILVAMIGLYVLVQFVLILIF